MDVYTKVLLAALLLLTVPVGAEDPGTVSEQNIQTASFSMYCYCQAIALNSWSYFGGRMPDVLTEEQKRRLESR